ncbi:MAG: hypothetical protein ACI9MC_001670 [Kiritimatiellia bacterium]
MLTAEDAPTTLAALRSKKIDVPVAIVDPALWVRLGRVNEKRPELPQPTLFVIDPHGAVVWSRGSQAYSDRTSAAHVVGIVRDLVEGKPPPASEVTPTPISMDEAPHVTVTAHHTGPRKMIVRVNVSDGWHVYGRRERSAEPISLHSDGSTLRAKIPDGERVVWDPNEPASRWLSGPIDVPVRSSVNHGELRYQACKRSICLPTATVPFVVSQRPPSTLE